MKTKFTFLTIVFFIGCEKDETVETFFDIQGEAGFVGTVDETDAFIALLIAEEEAIVYICNGDEQIAEWFKAPIDDPENIKLTNSAGATINAKFSGRTFSGVVTLRNNLTYTFSAAPNTGNVAGVFRVHGGDLAAQDNVEGGWILNSSNAERGTMKVAGQFKATPKMLAFNNVSGGTTNTILIGRKSYPFERLNNLL